MRKIILHIIVFLMIFALIRIAAAITGANEENNINVSSGQIEISPLSEEFSSSVRGAIQSIVGFGKDLSGSIEIRSGILAANYTPFTPLLINPSNNSFKNNESILFEWLAEDPNNDPLTSILEIYNDSASTQIYYINDTINESTYTLTIPEEITLYWKVITNNTMENSSYSELRVFTTDYTIPTEFNLTTPLNNTESKDTTPELTWLPTTELNLENYTIEFCSSDPSCENKTIIGTSTTTTFSNWTTNNALAQSSHYWQVRAVDKANNQNISDLFIYTVLASATETIITTTGGGGGETLGGTGVQLYSLSIISPPDITIYSNDTLTIPLIITNPATLITLSDIELNVSSDSEDVTPFLAATFIPQLRPKEQKTVPLTITTHTNPGTYGITITAHVLRPDFTDKVRILANLIEKDSAEKSKVSKQLGFAKDLLDGNPECLDLKEYIKEAELSLQENKYDQALNLVENAIQSCQKLISMKEITIKQPILEMPYIIKENKTIVIVIAESLAFILFLLVIHKIFFKKKKPKNAF